MANQAAHSTIDNLVRLAFASPTLIVFSEPVVRAQADSEVLTRAPTKIYEFVPYCTDQFSDCRSMVELVAKELWAEGQPHICAIGQEDREIATKSIVSWLARREETHAMSTNTGLRTAIKVLRHC
jgi:hypothetical protein